MAFTCTVDEQQQLGIARVSGAVDVDELLQVVRTLLDDPAWNKGYDILWEGLRITELVTSLSEMKEVAEASKDSIKGVGAGKTAIVVADDNAEHILYLFAAVARDPERERKVFSSLSDAQDWLGKVIPE